MDQILDIWSMRGAFLTKAQAKLVLVDGFLSFFDKCEDASGCAMTPNFNLTWSWLMRWRCSHDKVEKLLP